MTLAPSFVAFVLLLGLVALQRIAEAVVSARRARRASASFVPEGGGFVAMVAVHVGLIVLPPIEVLALGRPFDWRVAGAALAVLALATALRVWTLRTIGEAWNVRIVRPAADSVVTDGPYGLIRHPNYAVVVLEIVALPLVHGAWLSAVVLSLANGVVLTRRIRAEERVLGELASWRDAFRDRPGFVPRFRDRRR